MFGLLGMVVDLISDDDPFCCVTIRPARGGLGLQEHRIGATVAIE
jgi:hypothetical protein